MAMIAGGKGKPLVLRHPYNTLIDPHRPECKTFMQKLGNDPVVMRSGKTGQGRGWSPENGNTPVPDCMQGSQTQSDVHLLLCQKHKHDKSAAPYLLSVQQV